MYNSVTSRYRKYQCVTNFQTTSTTFVDGGFSFMILKIIAIQNYLLKVQEALRE